MLGTFKGVDGPHAFAMASRVLDERYEILEEIGRGGMAVVYRGRDRRLGGREVAIKVLHSHLAQSGDSRKRFKREADAAANLEHNNILKVYDASGLESRDAYIVMEYVQGRTLKELIDERMFHVPEVGAMIVHEVARALSHAHHASIIHRDIKPENILIRDDGVVKLADFGIARVLDSQQMTMTGALIGSPAHMSPEQIEGGATDERSDEFSLGILLYYVTTGVLPFQAPSPHAVLHKILVGRYETAERVNPAVGRPLSAIIDKSLSHAPEDRYQSVDELLEQLSSALRDVGIEDPSAELRAYYKAPAPYEEGLQARVVSHLLARAEAALVARRRAVALQHLNRILSLHDQHPAALDLLTRITRRHSRRKTAGLVLGALAVTALLAWLATGLLHRPPAPALPDGRAVVSATPSLPPPTLTPVLPRPEFPPREAEGMARFAPPTRGPLELTFKHTPVVETPVRVPPIKNETPTKAETPTPVDVTITAYPPAVAIAVDGAERGYGIARGMSLLPGPHEVVLRHPSCDECVKTTYPFKVEAGPPVTLRFAIKYKPAMLTVNANSPGSVWIFKSPRGSTGQPIKIDMNGPGTVDVPVRVEAPGFKDFSTRIPLTPGQSVARSITLTPLQPPL